MIKLLHFADLHLGVENYGRIDPSTGLSTRLMDFLHALDEVVDYALEHEVDAVIFAGDAYKTHKPNPTHQREFAKRIHRLSRAGITTVLVVGNHDVPSAFGRANTVEIFATLDVDNVHVIKRPEVNCIETKSGPLQIAALPWAKRSALLTKDEYKSKNLDEINELIAEKILNIVEGKDGLIQQLDPRLLTVLTAHATVQGAVYGSERSVMLGQEIVLPFSLVRNPVWDYVALGHIHKYQVLCQKPLAVYAGSLERIDFGEEKEEKGFVVVQVEKGWASHEFVTIHARPFVTIEVEAKGENPSAQILSAIEEQEIDDAVVRLIIHASAGKEPLINEREIRKGLKEAFHVAAIARDVERPIRLRLGEAAAIEQLTPRQMLSKYLQIKGASSEHTEVLLKYAEEIFQDKEE